MIQLLTVFLGLVVGVHSVELNAAPGVAAIRLELDGVAAGRLGEPPWKLDVDFGAELSPHELVAIALDGEGRELDRLTHWVNLTPPSVDELTAVAVEVDEGYRLPPPEEMKTWFVRGGTPIPVAATETGRAEVAIVRDPGAQPYLDRLADGFYEPAFERLRGTGTVEVDRLDEAQLERWMSLDPGTLPGRQAPVVRLAQDDLRAFVRLGADTVVRFVSPLAAAPSRVRKERSVFHLSQRLSSAEGGFLWQTQEVPSVPAFWRLADAVAVTGRELHASGRRRAVVLLLAFDWEDRGLYQPSQVRSYLRGLLVPVFVWSATCNEPPPDWGEAVCLDPIDRPVDQHVAMEMWRDAMEAAVGALGEELESQRIVWLRGRHPPQEIELGGEAPAAIRLAGR